MNGDIARYMRAFKDSKLDIKSFLITRNLALPYVNEKTEALCLVHSFDYAHNLYNRRYKISANDFACMLSESNIIVIDRFEIAYHADYDKPYFWSGNKLFVKNKPYAELVPHQTYKGMFYIRWTKRDTMSTDFYNVSRAKCHCLNMAKHDRLL